MLIDMMHPAPEPAAKIDDRHDLIANIIAERYLRDTAGGCVGYRNVSAARIGAASRAGPTAFSQSDRLSIIEDLPEKMVSLDGPRRGAGEVWSLRTKNLRLLGYETKVTSRVVALIDRPSPRSPPEDAPGAQVERAFIPKEAR
ncbi:hypothetical protein MKK68_12025 [Methylobacterium sp. E-016]|uniref:hypothetical protein n=1 Tax=Methylobacterium sp. E-016 TaxID=2836556 RepID=UPI001FBA23F4|nr:hypothetical protein [Methylobacterium sp. E-016]MCJ2076375.1 hypothetical protein [Methylobacterium sp. E-016]